MVVDAHLHANAALRDILDAKGVRTVLTEAPSSEEAAGSPTLRAAIEAASADAPEVEIASEQLAFIMYTSGTTGRPKGVMHSHASVHSALMSNAVEAGCTTSGDVWSGMLPMSHVAGYGNLLDGALCVGLAVAGVVSGLGALALALLAWLLSRAQHTKRW